MNVHEAQTAILIWLWEQDHPIADGEAMAIVCEGDDDQWRITLKGLEQLDARGD